MIAPRSPAPLPLLLLIGLTVLCLSVALTVALTVQAQSQEVTQTADATGGNPPAKPTNLQASAGHDEVVLTWTASSDQTVTHYAILRRNRDTDATGVFHVIESNAGPGTSYTDASVSPSSRYNYRVKAVSPTGVSQWSGYVQAETPAAPPPTSTATPTPTSTPAPEDLRPTGLTVSLVENKVTLSWTAPAEDADSVTGYEILRRRPMEGETALATLAADTESTATTYTDATANEAGVRYVYRVKARRGSEASPWSNFYAIDLPADYEAPQEDGPATATTPGAPSLSTLMIVTSASIILSWSAPADDGGSAVTGYRIEYSEDSGDTWQTLVEDTGTTETEYTHGGLEPETTLHYRVSAINEHGAGPPSDAVSATTLPAPVIALPQVSKDSNVFLEFNIDTSTVILTDQDMPVVLVKQHGADQQRHTSSGHHQHQACPSVHHRRQPRRLHAGLHRLRLRQHHRHHDCRRPPGCDAERGQDSDGNPASSALCTLTDPATFSTSGVQTFDAPTTDPCPTLAASTTYFAVIERVTTVASATITLHRTGMAAEDAGDTMGWSIGDTLHTFASGDGMWGTTPSQSYLVVVNGSVDNNPATGVPTISGKPRVGKKLATDTSAIMDADGTDSATFTYQWVSVDGTIEANIGSDCSTYALMEADADKQIKVKVSFTDDAMEMEGPLESLPTESVVADDVLVQNTAQTANVMRFLESTNSGEAQQFTSGSQYRRLHADFHRHQFQFHRRHFNRGQRADGNAERGEQQQSGRRSLHAERPGDLLRLRSAHLHCSDERHAVPRACAGHKLPGCHHPGEQQCRQYQSLHGGLGEHRFRQRDGLVNPE